MAHYIYTESYVSVPVPNYDQVLKPLADNCHFDHKLLNLYLIYDFAGWDFEIFCGSFTCGDLTLHLELTSAKK